VSRMFSHKSRVTRSTRREIHLSPSSVILGERRSLISMNQHSTSRRISHEDLTDAQEE